MDDAKTPSHIERVSEDDIEKILETEQIPKFGERFRQYRQQYIETIAGVKTASGVQSPITLGIELLNKCNFKCSMCLTPSLDEPKIVIPETVQESLINQIRDQKIPAVMFGMGEEPLLFKNFVSFVRKISDAGVMDIFLFTNGLLMNEAISTALVDMPITRVYFSIDAATPETFKRVRGKDELERVESNIKNFLRIKQIKGSRLPITRVSFCLTEQNKHEKEAFINKWRPLVDHVDIQTVHDFSRVTEMSKLSPQELFRSGDEDVEGSYCGQPWEKLTVWANGDVSPCCTFHGKNLIIGNINFQTISELWNSDKINQVRKQLSSGKLNPVCHECLSKRGV
jgi:radical SAM protein with 4Fe4S-binding SPASM domain